MARTRRDRLRKFGSIALGVAVVSALIAIALLALRLFSSSPSKETEHQLLLWAAVMGILGGLSAFVSLIVNISRRPTPLEDRRTLALPARQEVLLPHLMDDALLVDRSSEVNELITKIRRSRAVNCFGDQGAGKSFLLSHLTDVVNGFRSRNPGHRRLRRISAALYYDLADAIGFEGIQAHVCGEFLGREDGTWDDFIARVNDVFGNRKVLLVLDNVNTPALWLAVGSAAFRYLRRRPKDKLVLGSIAEAQLNNLPAIERVQIGELGLDDTEDLVAANGISIPRDELAALHEQFRGLPLYSRMLAPFGSGGEKRDADGMEAAIEAELVPRIEIGARALLAYISLKAVVSRQVSVGELEALLLPDLEAQLAATRGMLTPIPGDRRLFKIHDVLRDVFLRALTQEVSIAANTLFRQAKEQHRSVDAAFFAMFADPAEIGPAAFDEVFEAVVRDAVMARNYALLDNLHIRASQSARTLQFLAADQRRRNLFFYGRASQLAGVGKYVDAEEKLMQGSIRHVSDLRRTLRSRLEFEMQFLLADIAHLQNRYGDAIGMFGELGEWAFAKDHQDLYARCVWGRAHVLRHQGRELNEALSLFEDAIELAGASSELFSKAYSTTGATGIKVFLGTVPADEEKRLAAIEGEIASTHKHHSYKLEVWKSQAQVAWFRGEVDRALEIVEGAIEKALELNDRLVYNLYFERAEFRRLGGRPQSALSDYRRVLEFGESNGDRNLISNSLLGLVLVDLSSGGWRHHGSQEQARASAATARQTALDADIQATGRIAERVVARIDEGPGDRVEALRLILF